MGGADGRVVRVRDDKLFLGRSTGPTLAQDGTYPLTAEVAIEVQASRIVNPGVLKGCHPQPEPPATP